MPDQTTDSEGKVQKMPADPNTTIPTGGGGWLGAPMNRRGWAVAFGMWVAGALMGAAIRGLFHV